MPTLFATMTAWLKTPWRCRLGDHADLLDANRLTCRDCGRALPDLRAKKWAEHNTIDYR